MKKFLTSIVILSTVLVSSSIAIACAPVNPVVTSTTAAYSDEYTSYNFLIHKVTSDGQIYGDLIDENGEIDLTDEGIYLVEGDLKDFPVHPDRAIQPGDIVTVTWDSNDAKEEVWDDIKGVQIMPTDFN